MKLKRILKSLILGLIITQLSFALDINPELDRVIKESELKILSNKGNVLILENDKIAVKLSPIDKIDFEKEKEILEKLGVDLNSNELQIYKKYGYQTILIPIKSINSNVIFEMIYPINYDMALDWQTRYAQKLIHEYIFNIVDGEKLKSEYSSLLIQKREEIDRIEKEKEDRDRLEKSLNQFKGIMSLPNNIKNYITLSNEISFDRISKRNEFWIDLDSEKYISGKVTLRDENKNLYMEQEFKKGLPHGKFRSYNENNFKIMVEGQYEKGQKEGKWTYYYDNGNKKQIERYENGKLSGDFISYYKNKEKKSEGEYENGEKEGKWIYYYENGEKEEEGKYENDKKVKKWKYFNTNGKLREEKKHSFTLF